MVKKMCPVCDLPVTAGNYCPRCRKIIRKPYTQNVDYYLNERHPENERDCGFHNPYLEADHHRENERFVRTAEGASDGSRDAAARMQSGQTGYGQTGRGQAGQSVRPVPASSQGANRPAGSRPAMAPPSGAAGTGSQSGTYRPMGTGASGPYRTVPGNVGMNGRPGGTGSVIPQTGQNRGGRNVLVPLLIGGVMVVMVLAVGVGAVVFNTMRNSLDYTEAYVDDYEYDGESFYTDLTDEEVMEAGEECMGYSHFQADGAYVGEQLLDAIQNSDYGYTVESDDLYTDNYLYEDISYFESTRSFYLSDEASRELEGEYIYQYVDLNYDTVTGRVHEYSSNIYNSAAALAFLERFLTAVEDSSQIAPEERKAEAIMEEARETVALGQSSYIYEGQFAVGIYRYEGEASLYIYVSYNDPAGSVASIR